MLDLLKTNNNNDEATSSTHTLFVSLYLVVLAFFILLNSISETDKIKADKALSSLEKVFSGGLGKSYVENKIEIFDFPLIVASYFDSIEELMRSSFQLEEIDVVRSGNKMRVVIPLNKFFEKASADLVRGQKKDP